MERMNRSSEVSVVNITHEGDHPAECNNIGTSSPRKNELISNNAWPSAFVSSAGKTADAGPGKERPTDCLSHEPEAFVSHLAQVEAECGDSNEESLTCIERWPKVKKSHYSETVEAFIPDALLFGKCNTPDRLAHLERREDGKCAHFNYVTDESTDSKMTPYTYLHPLVECKVDEQTLGLKGTLCRQRSHSKVLAEANNESPNKFSVITSQTSDEETEYVLPVSYKERSALIELPLSRNGNSLNEWRVKEGVRDAGCNRSVSEEDDSNGSAESSSSKEPCSRGKRAWSWGPKILTESKRMRKLIVENSCSASPVRESSFMNWASSVTKGFFRSHHMEVHSFGLIPNPVPSTQRNLVSSLQLRDTNNSSANGIMGFGSIFKPLHHPRLGKSTKVGSPDYQGLYADFKGLHSAKSVMEWMPHDNEAIELPKAVPMSTMKNDQGVCQFRECPLDIPNTSLRSSPIQEKMKHSTEENCSLCKLGSSSSSFQNGSRSHSEGAEHTKLGTFEPNKLSDLSMKKTGRFPENIWITRLLTKVSAPVPCAIKCHHDRTPAAGKLTDDHSTFLHDFRNDSTSVRDCSNSENIYLSSKDQGHYTNGRQHKDSVGPMGSCCPKNVSTDEVKFNVNPIVPSPMFKKMEPMTSVFPKRFDALRHITTPKADAPTPEGTTCCFCGKIGHSVTTCSESINFELEDHM